MRLTLALCEESFRWRLKQLWKTKGLVYPLTTRMPLYVKQEKDRGKIKVETGAEYLKEPNKFPHWEPPVKDDLQFMPPKTIQDHPDYHEEWVYKFSKTSRLCEGVEQALLLTKTQPFSGLPKGVVDLVGKHSLPDQDLLTQRAIMQSNVWHPTQEKLPRRKNPELKIWKFKAEVGIPNARIASTMVRNLTQIIDMALYRTIPASLSDRRTLVDPLIDTFYFHGDKHISVVAEGDSMICSRQPLPLFADEATVDASTAFKLPNIYPLAPTIDLEHRHVWRGENQPGFSPGFSHPHIHTLYSLFDDDWTVAQRYAKALVFCFGTAVSMAKLRYGNGVRKLDEPISTACVLTNGSKFYPTCFQLNTLDIHGDNSDNAGIKNLVWFGGENELYKKIIPKRAMLRNTRYEDYDPEVLQRLIALSAYGLKEGVTVRQNREKERATATA